MATATPPLDCLTPDAAAVTAVGDICHRVRADGGNMTRAEIVARLRSNLATIKGRLVVLGYRLN